MATDTETKKQALTSGSKLTPSQLITRVRTRFGVMEEGDHDNRRDASDDIEFLNVPGKQWEKTVRDARGTRPCYEFNKARIKAKRVVNEMRANRPVGKVRAVEDGDVKTAQVIEGLGRNILQVSDFDTISDYAGEYQVGGGAGAWRVSTEFTDDSFDQDILVKAIPYPLNLFWDPASTDPIHRDAEDWALIDSYANTAFQERWGDVKATDFEGPGEFLDEPQWRDEHSTRVCEYHWKERYDKRLIKLIDGRVIDAADPAADLIPVQNIKATRIAACHRIFMCITSANKILTPATELKGKYHRFIVVHGEWMMVKGKPKWCGITRFAKDAQRAYNVASTAVTETIATAPNSHYWVTTKEAFGNTEQWNKAIAENMPFLQYNADPAAPGRPQKTGGADVPVSLIQEAQIRDQELKDVMGVYDASLGDKSTEQSGIAISRRTEQGQIVNFNFPDNMSKGKQFTLVIINDLIPFYYDTARTIRVLGVDGAEEYVKINTAGIDPKTGEPVILNDLSKGKYDVTVTVGPSFATQRQEAVDGYTALAPQDPLLMASSADLVYKAMDLPYSDQISERRRAMMPPQIQAIIQQGKDVPPEVAQAQQMLDTGKQQLDQQGQLVAKAAAEAKEQQAAADKSTAELKVALANIQTAQANLKADRAALATDVANFKVLAAEANSALVEQRVSMGEQNSQNTQAANVETFEGQLQQALAKMERNLTAQFQQHASNLSELHKSALQSAQPQVFVSPAAAPQAGRKRIITRRVADGFVSEIHPMNETAPGVQ